MLKVVCNNVAGHQFHLIHEKHYQNEPALKRASLDLHELNKVQTEVLTNQQPPACFQYLLLELLKLDIMTWLCISTEINFNKESIKFCCMSTT